MTESGELKEDHGQSEHPCQRLRRPPLNLRQYIGLLTPNAFSVREAREEARNRRPLTLREYIGLTPMLNLDDLIDISRWAGRGVQRLWHGLTTNNLQNTPENSDPRFMRGLAAGLITGVPTFVAASTLLQMGGVPEDSALLTSFAIMVPTMAAAYYLGQRR